MLELAHLIKQKPFCGDLYVRYASTIALQKEVAFLSQNHAEPTVDKVLPEHDALFSGLRD
jgi:hypothetical protein